MSNKESPNVRQRAGENVKGSKGEKLKSSQETKSPKQKKKDGKPAVATVHAPDSAAGGSFLQKLVKRIIVGAILLSVFAFIVLSDHLYISLLVIVIQGVVFREIISLRFKTEEARASKVPWFRTLNWYFFLVSLVYVYGEPMTHYLRPLLPEKWFGQMIQYHLSLSFTLYCAGFVAFILTLRAGKYKFQFTQSAWTLMTLVMIVAQSSVVILNIFDGLIWFLLPSSLIIFNDIMAFFCGVLFGNKIIKKPFLALSPNKTWEGFIGGGICTVIFAFFFAQLLSQYKWFTCPKQDFSIGQLDCIPDPIFAPAAYHLPAALGNLLSKSFGGNWETITILPMQLHAVWFGLFASIVAPFGGFFASGLKRAFGIKDFDSIFPGHGGMTDRMDCQLLMGLCVYVHLHSLVKVGGITVASLLHSAAFLPREQQRELYEKLGQMLLGK